MSSKSFFWSAILAVLLFTGVLAIGAIHPARQTAAAQSAAALSTFPYYEDAAIAAAVDYLHSQQQPDGGIDTFGLGASAGGTIRTVLALGAAGYPIATLTAPNGSTMLDYLATQASSYTGASTTPSTTLRIGATGQLLAAVAVAGEDPADFGGVDLIEQLTATYHPPTGAYSSTLGGVDGRPTDINQALAILGLSAAGQPVPAQATDYLIGLRGENGSWGGGSVDTTGFAVVALISSGNVQPGDPAIQDAIAFLGAARSPAGLWGLEGDFAEPANSTGWVIHALSVAGFTPLVENLWADAGRPRLSLQQLQQSNGSIGLNAPNALSTAEAIYGLTDQALFFGRPLRILRALTWLNEQQNADGSWNGFGGTPDASATLESVLAFTAAGFDPASVTAEGSDTSALDYLRSTAEDFTRDEGGRIFAGQTGKLIVGIVASGADPRAFGLAGSERDLVAELVATLQPTGAYSSTAAEGFTTGEATAFNQALAILGLVAAGESIPQDATSFLIGLQQVDGGWLDFGFSSPDATAIALQALVASGNVPASSPAIRGGLAFLRSQQNARGG